MRIDPFIRLIALIVGTILIVNAASCTKYKAQKTPFPVGTTGLYFNDITPGYTPTLTVDSYYFDNFDEYDGAFHFFYIVHDAKGKQFSHVIDYQLKK